MTSAASPVRDAAWIRTARPRRRARLGGRRLLGLRRPRGHGPCVAGAARPPRLGRPVRRRVPVLDEPGDRPRLRHGAGHPDHLRRGVGLGALRPDRVRRRRVRGPPRAPGPTSVSPTRGTTQSTAFVSTRGTGPSAPTSPRTTPRWRRVCASPASSQRRSTSWAARALESAIAAGPRRRLVSFRVGDPAAMLWGGELVLHDGAPAGQVSSAAWSATCGAAVGLAYVWRRDRGPVKAEDLASGNVGGHGGRPGDADGRPARGALRPDVGPGPELSGFPVCSSGYCSGRGRLSNAHVPAGTLAFSDQADTTREEDHGEDRGFRPRLRRGLLLRPGERCTPSAAAPARGAQGSSARSTSALAPDIADPAVFPSNLRAHPGTGCTPGGGPCGRRPLSCAIRAPAVPGPP